MKVLYSPQMRIDDKINYVFEGDKIIATYKGVTDEFDFTGIPDGDLEIYDTDTMPCTLMIETSLEFLPLISVSKRDGILMVELVNFIGYDATEEEKFPIWKEV